MPRTSRKTRIADPETEPITSDTLVPAGSGEFEAEKPDILPPAELPYFEYLEALSPRQWERRLLYLYRLDPAVRNATGNQKYIQRYAGPVDEDTVKQQHGGGKYMFVLNNVDAPRGQRGERTHTFMIDGPPKFIEGQTVVGANGAAAPAAAPAAAGEGSLVDLLRQMVADRNNTPEKAMEVFISTITKAQEASQQIIAKAAEKSADSTTGNPLLDRLLSSALERLTAAPSSQFDQLKQMVELMTLMRQLNPEPKAAAGGLGLSGLKEVAELAGKETIADLFSGGGGAEDWRAVLARAGMAFIQNLPQMIDGFRNMQQENFNRALEVERWRSSQGIIARPVQPGAIPPAPRVAPAQTPAAAGAAAGGDAMQQVALLIVKLFDAGIDGAGAARMVRIEFPQLLPTLKPYFEAPPAEIKQFCQADPILSSITAHEDFDEYLEEFVAELLEPESEVADAPAARAAAAPQEVPAS